MKAVEFMRKNPSAKSLFASVFEEMKNSSDVELKVWTLYLGVRGSKAAHEGSSIESSFAKLALYGFYKLLEEIEESETWEKCPICESPLEEGKCTDVGNNNCNFER